MTYCTASGVKAFINDSTAYDADDFPSDAEILELINMADNFIDYRTDRVWYLASGVEYYDHNGEEILLSRHFPIVSVTELAEIQSDFTYSALIETRNTDNSDGFFIKDADSGQIYISDPTSDLQAYRLTYQWGFSTTPKIIQRLSTYMVARDILFRLSSSNDDSDITRQWNNEITLFEREIARMFDVLEREYNWKTGAL